MQGRTLSVFLSFHLPLSFSTFSSTFILKNRRDNELYLGQVQASGSLISIHSADGETAARNPRKIAFHISVLRIRVIRVISCIVSFAFDLLSFEYVATQTTIYSYSFPFPTYLSPFLISIKKALLKMFECKRINNSFITLASNTKTLLSMCSFNAKGIISPDYRARRSLSRFCPRVSSAIRFVDDRRCGRTARRNRAS